MALLGIALTGALCVGPTAAVILSLGPTALQGISEIWVEAAMPPQLCSAEHTAPFGLPELRLGLPKGRGTACLGGGTRPQTVPPAKSFHSGRGDGRHSAAISEMLSGVIFHWTVVPPSAEMVTQHPRP